MDAVVDRPRAIACAALALAATAVWSDRLSRNRPLSAVRVEPAQAMPDQLGQWRGKSLTVDARAVEILETDNVSLMEYRKPRSGEPVWLAFVAGFGNRAAFHPPEICYVGSHYEVLERGVISVVVPGGQSRRLMRLLIGQGKERYEAWYWFTANDRVTPNYYQQQAWLLLGAIQGRRSSGTLVRISTPSEAVALSHARLSDFLAAWEASSWGVAQ